VFVGSISIGQYSKELLAIFYPQEQYLVLNLGIALPALMAILIISFREKLWQKNISWLFLMIKPLIVFSLILDFAVHVFWANLDHWQFSWAIAITLILDVMCLFFIAKDKHTRAMLRDWRMHPPVSTNSSWP
jgi:hypothetical protein